MKTLLAATLLFIVPLGTAHAGCSASDFSIQNTQANVVRSTANPHVILMGKLINNCPDAAAAQINIVAKDASGKVVMSKKAWPAGTSNISPGKSVNFNLGRLFRYRPSLNSFVIHVVSVRIW